MKSATRGSSRAYSSDRMLDLPPPLRSQMTESCGLLPPSAGAVNVSVRSWNRADRSPTERKRSAASL